MTRRCVFWLTAISVLGVGCGSSSGNKDTGPTEDAGANDDVGVSVEPDGGMSSSNVAPVVINSGPPGTSSADVPFVSVTLCVPGTTNCQTIDYVSVDTGSSGLRIISSALSKNLALPQVNATTGDALVECFQFGDGYTWGSVRTADVKIAGEIAAHIPLQLIGDPTFASVPGDCSSSGPSENTVATFGGNGLIGINQIVPDCGDYCADPNDPGTGSYYSCSDPSSCTSVAVANAKQVSNPIAFFDADKNGAILQFPTVASTGAPKLSGTLTFGIGTAANNALGSAKIITVDGDGDFTTIYKGQTLTTSFIDSGTNALSFNDSSIAQCTSDSGFYCPASPLNLTAQNKGRNGVTTTVSFSVASAETLFGHGANSAFDDLATTGFDNDTFDWGLPFFIGRSVYVALEGAKTPGGPGPYFAY